MAFSPKLISFFFLLMTPFFVQINARDSQFFSKVSGTTTTTSVNNPTTTINSKDTTFPNKEEENLKNQEQEPTFMPETQNGYGLYGQESNDQEYSTQFPTTTKLGNAPYATTTYSPYKTQTQETYTYYPNANTNANANGNANAKANYYSNDQYNNNGYEEQQQQENLGETSFQERGYTPLSYQNNNNNYNSYNGASEFNQEATRQGMSDTRFMENGKYYYDPKKENRHYQNQFQNSRNSVNKYDTYYNNYNNENPYGYNKYSMENQQENFQDSQDEQYVP